MHKFSEKKQADFDMSSLLLVQSKHVSLKTIKILAVLSFNITQAFDDYKTSQLPTPKAELVKYNIGAIHWGCSSFSENNFNQYITESNLQMLEDNYYDNQSIERNQISKFERLLSRVVSYLNSENLIFSHHPYGIMPPSSQCFVFYLEKVLFSNNNLHFLRLLT